MNHCERFSDLHSAEALHNWPQTHHLMLIWTRLPQGYELQPGHTTESCQTRQDKPHEDLFHHPEKVWKSFTRPTEPIYSDRKRPADPVWNRSTHPSIYPSIVYTRLIRRSGHGGAGAYPSGHRSRDGVHPGQVQTNSTKTNYDQLIPIEKYQLNQRGQTIWPSLEQTNWTMQTEQTDPV